MKEYRGVPKPSSVAAKEAVLIKEWLIAKGLISKAKSHDEQSASIRFAINRLIGGHFLKDIKG